MRLKEYFFDDSMESEDEQRHEDVRRFQEKSTWIPPRNSIPALDTYLQVVERDTLHLVGSVKRKDNITLEERSTITKLCNHNDIIIKPADKGSATEILSKEAYVAEAFKQLSNTTYYKKLDTDPTNQCASNIFDFVQMMSNNHFINEETRKYLTPSSFRTAKFYHILKIHKPSIPGRPIVSSCGAPSECISEFVDYHLHPLVIQTESYDF